MDDLTPAPPPRRGHFLEPVFAHDPIGEYLKRIDRGEVRVSAAVPAGSAADVEQTMEMIRQQIIDLLTEHPCRGCPHLMLADLPQPAPKPSVDPQNRFTFGNADTEYPYRKAVGEYAAYNYIGKHPFCRAHITVSRDPYSLVITDVRYGETWHRCPLYGVLSVNQVLADHDRSIDSLADRISKLEVSALETAVTDISTLVKPGLDKDTAPEEPDAAPDESTDGPEAAEPDKPHDERPDHDE